MSLILINFNRDNDRTQKSIGDLEANRIVKSSLAHYRKRNLHNE
ncbi:hypothetical protein [Chamaesiphon sp. VAR_48_metabat_403]|nr:hypothetical protein [Chamaesiphon sp. VAR_48_metabat_403]